MEVTQFKKVLRTYVEVNVMHSCTMYATQDAVACLFAFASCDRHKFKLAASLRITIYSGILWLCYT